MLARTVGEVLETIGAEQEIPAVVLAGGLGTRLRAVVQGAPKPMAAVGGQPFLELLIGQLHSQGIRRLILCTGYLAEQIERDIGDGSKWGMSIEYSAEAAPLGTGGAVKFAEARLRDAPCFLVMNGDSFCAVDFMRLVALHRRQECLVSMAVVGIPDASRYGTVQLGDGGRVTGFLEKTKVAGPGLINAGVYVFDRSIFTYVPEGPSSLERDLFPRVLDRQVYAWEQHGAFIDIGTPEDYVRAQALYSELWAVAFGKHSAESEHS